MPGALITTSHKPSQRTRSFIKDLSLIIPFSTYTSRGKKTIQDLALEAYRLRKQHIIIVCEKRGNPSLLRIYKIVTEESMPKIKHLASIVLRGVKLTRENPDASRAYNPETVGIEYYWCQTDTCFKLADLLLKIFGELLSEAPDIKIVLKEQRKTVTMLPMNKLGKICGPILRVKEVIIND